MKKAMGLLLSLLLTVSLAGCNKGVGNSSSNVKETSSSNGLIPEDGWNEIPSDTTESNPSSEIQSDEIASVASTVSKQTNAMTSSKKAETQTSSGTTSLNQEQTKPGALKEVYKPTFAKGFQIEYYYGGAKIISTNFSTTSEEGVTNIRKQRILILPQGAAQPIGVKWDKKIDGAVTRVVTLASAHAGHFANLNAIDSIKGTSLSPTSCEIPELKKALEDGTVQYLKSQSDSDGSKYFDQEIVAQLQPQVVFVGGMQADVLVAKKLEESGMNCVYIGDFAEDSYMGRAQWIELFGAFIGKEQQGQDFLKDGVKRANHIIARAQKIQKTPKVLWFNTSKSPWSVKTDKDYTASFIKDLGGQLLCPKTDDNAIYLQSEEFLPYLLQADKVVYGNSLKYIKFTSAEDITDLNAPGIDFGSSPAYQSGDCYAVGYDWAQDTANIGDIMEDLAKMMYPDEFKDLASSNKIVTFRKSNKK